MSTAIKNRTRDEIIAAFDETINVLKVQRFLRLFGDLRVFYSVI